MSLTPSPSPPPPLILYLIPTVLPTVMEDGKGMFPSHDPLS